MQEILPAKIYKIADHSMEPTLKPGDYILANLWFIDVAENDIVVLKHPRKDLILVKRISRIDGRKVFLIGDNKKYSEDSRKFGPVTRGDIIAKMAYKV